MGTQHLFSQNLKVFSRIYKHKAHVHHYTQYMEKSMFDEAFEASSSLVKDYIHVDMMQEPPPSCTRRMCGTVPSAASLLLTPSRWATEQALASPGLRSLQSFTPTPII